nr:MAG TPA: hypothetical protein [Caudoviricetes sp.]
MSSDDLWCLNFSKILLITSAYSIITPDLIG